MIRIPSRGTIFLFSSQANRAGVEAQRNQPAKSPQSQTEPELASPSIDLAVRKQRTEQKFDSIQNILRILTQKGIEIHVLTVQCEKTFIFRSYGGLCHAAGIKPVH